MCKALSLKSCAGVSKQFARHRPVFVIENDLERAHELILLQEGYRRASYEKGRFVLDKVDVQNTFYIPADKAEQIHAAYR